jgi:mannose-6-phosphate isomerase-like protein (cupin superfamily)
MENICLVNFAGKEQHDYIIGCRVPQTDPAYSEYLDIGYNHQSFSWHDETSHFHKSSEEYFIVLNGQLDFLIQNRQLSVKPGQLLSIRSGIEHQIIGGLTPIENFLIRVPGGGKDKISLPIRDSRQVTSSSNNTEPVLLNIRQSFTDYLLGGCLPENHVNYSPLLDFTCVWGVDPKSEWKNEQLHFHTLREEYYIVLRGRLDFAIESSTVSVNAGQILGVKPTTTHKVIGGKEPVDILFIRVPGGRGDKIIA